jgi:hypothetical protein
MTEHGAHPGVGSLLLPLINFLLFAGIIVWKLPGPVREFFRDRTARLARRSPPASARLPKPRRRARRWGATSASCRPPSPA